MDDRCAPSGGKVLAYGRARLRRRWRFWALLIACLCISLGMLAVRWRGPIVSHINLLRVQSACASNQLPPDVVCFDSFPATSQQLLGAPQYRRVNRSRPDYGVIRTDPNWLKLTPSLTRHATHRGVIFMHERTSPGGKRRLVVIFGGNPDSFASEVIEMGTLLSATPV